MEERECPWHCYQRWHLLSGFCTIRNFHATKRALFASRAAQEFEVRLMRHLVCYSCHDILRFRVSDYSHNIYFTPTCC